MTTIKDIVVLTTLEDLLRDGTVNQRRAAREVLLRIVQGKMTIDEVYLAIKGDK